MSRNQLDIPPITDKIAMPDIEALKSDKRLKKFSQEGKCSLDAMCAIMSEEKKGELDRVTIKNDVLRKYFPKSYTPKQMEEKIIQLLEQWQKKREKSMER